MRAALADSGLRFDGAERNTAIPGQDSATERGMETSLHRQLKALYAPAHEEREVRLEGYRIDAICDSRLIEIQCASLAAIRRKIEHLLERHDVLVVKPLAVRKFLVTRRGRRPETVSSRYSPLKATPLSVFHELVHFLPPFPHPRLTVEIVLAEVEEHRTEKAPRRRFGKNYRVDDRLLREVRERLTLKTAADLAALLPPLPETFSTGDLATAAGIPRWLAQKALYCLRKIDSVAVEGKAGNALIYRRVRAARRKRRAA